MVTVEDDRSSASNVTDGPSDPIEEDTLNNGYTSKVDDGCNIDGGTLMSKREESPRSSASELVADFSTFC